MLALSALALLGLAVSPPARPPKKPNVLFIVVDDLNAKIGAYGYPVRTPNIERLARRGRRFDSAYAQYPLCSPSRTSLMTGWRPEKTKVWGNFVPPRPHLDGAVPLEERFHANGYFTARVGKVYHGRFEAQFKWDVAEDPGGLDPEAEEEVRPPGAPRRKHRNRFSALWTATDSADEDEPDGRTARRVVQILERSAGKPFFVAAGFQRPHGPWIAPKKYFEMYPEKEVVLPPEQTDDLDDVPEIALNVGSEPPIPEDKRQMAIAAYSACVTFMDAQLGVILDALDRLKLWDSTIVVLLSDNGIHRGEHGLWRKNTLFEESAHVPLLIAAPDLKQPGVPTRALAELLDVYPTLVELAGLPKADGLQGRSLVPLLLDPAASVKSAAFSVVERGGLLARSVRTERYRYTEWPDDDAELYDHDLDPNEFTNRADDKLFAPIVAELKKLLRE
jgi:uncharacterized sulfatase